MSLTGALNKVLQTGRRTGGLVLKVAGVLVLFGYWRKLSHTDRLSVLAFLVSVSSILLGIFQFSEARRQFELQQIAQKSADSINTAQFISQFEAIQRKDSIDRMYYSEEAQSNRRRDSIAIAKFELERIQAEFKLQLDRLYYRSQIEQDEQSFSHLRKSDSLSYANAIANQKLAVRPVINGNANSSHADGACGFFLSNGGLGPAEIENIQIYYKGSLLERTLDLSDFFQRDYPTTCADWGRCSYWSQVDSVFVILPNQRLYLFQTPIENVTDSYGFSRVMNSYLTIIVNYRSFFGERFRYAWKPENLKKWRK